MRLWREGVERFSFFVKREDLTIPKPLGQLLIVKGMEKLVEENGLVSGLNNSRRHLHTTVFSLV